MTGQKVQLRDHPYGLECFWWMKKLAFDRKSMTHCHWNLNAKANVFFILSDMTFSPVFSLFQMNCRQ